MSSLGLPEEILLVDRDAALVAAWAESLGEEEAFEVVRGDYFARPADAMVSPANSFGIMDGGLDLAIRGELGHEVQDRAQRVIVERHHGELPVGQAEVVETGFGSGCSARVRRSPRRSPICGRSAPARGRPASASS